MKSFLNIILKLLLVFGTFIILDFIYTICSYNFLIYTNMKEYRTQNEKEFFNKNIKPKFKYFPKVRHFKYLLKNQEFQTYENTKKDKSIILFGCSFAYGAFLDEKETFAYKLSKQTGRTVYNRALCAKGFGQMLYQTETENLYNSIKDTPEYAMYVYIPDHLFRSCFYKYGKCSEYIDEDYLSYDLHNGKLEENTPLFTYLNRLSIFRDITEKILCSPKVYATDEKKNFDFIKAHFVQAKENLQKNYPNLKFVIIKYPFNTDNPNNYNKDSNEYANMTSYYSKRWKELEDKGFIILDLEKLTNINVNDKKYQLPDRHPNGKAWDIITPEIVETLKL